MGRFRYIASVLLSILVVGISYAAELTAEQKRFRSTLQQFLREEGFMPTIDEDDNSLNFKKEGTLFWITFGGSAPLYIEIHRAGLDCEGADQSLVLQAVNTANRKIRCAKAMFNNTTVSFAVEMYCHSAEEFKYIFYKSLKELDNIREEVLENYNGEAASTSSTGTGTSTNIFDRIFPVYGITLGKTTISQAQAMGYTIESSDSGYKTAKAYDVTFWDFNKDNIFDYVTFYEYKQVPESIRNLGLNWNMSYNQMLAKFKELGFAVKVTEQPTTEKWENRKTLKAKFEAISQDKKFKVIVAFAYGNENGEGYSVSSPNSFRSMTFDVDY